MKNIITCCLLLLVVSYGCSRDIPYPCEESMNNGETTVVVSATISSENPKSKMFFNEIEDADNHIALHSTWSDTDKITITPDSGDSSEGVVFRLFDGAGTSHGTFVSESVVPSESKTWTVFYPSFIKSDEEFESYSFDGQVQIGNDNPAHLSDFNILRKKYIYDSPQKIPSKISFSGENFEQPSCIKFNLSNFPTNIIPKSLTLEVYGYGAEIWLGHTSMAEMDVYENINFSQTISFSDMTDTSSLTAYMMLPLSMKRLVDADFDILRITVIGTDGKTIYTERNFSDDLVIEAGSYNILNINKNWICDRGIDGSWGTLQSPSNPDMVASLCNFIIMGDGYTSQDYEGEDGKFLKDAKEVYEALFSIEPYKSLKDYFGVYYVNVVSGQKIHTTGTYINGAKNVDNHTSLELVFTPNETTITTKCEPRIFYYAGKVRPLNSSLIAHSTICVIANINCHAGSCIMKVNDGYSIAFFALGNDGPNKAVDFRNTVIHEACGHGFGKAGDEYTMPKQFTDVPKVWDDLEEYHKNGVYNNVSRYESGKTILSDTPWATLSSVDEYKPEQIGVYEGAFAVSNGFCRSTPNSIMKSPTSPGADYFNAITRKQIFHRVMRLSGRMLDDDNSFIEWDTAHLPQTGVYQGEQLNQVSLSTEGLLPLAPPTLVY